MRNTPERSGNEGDTNRPPVQTLSVEVTIPLKYLSNFWRFLDLPLINYEIELDLSWTKDCVLIEWNNNSTAVNFVILAQNVMFQLLLCLLIIISNANKEMI